MSSISVIFSTSFVSSCFSFLTYNDILMSQAFPSKPFFLQNQTEAAATAKTQPKKKPFSPC